MSEYYNPHRTRNLFDPLGKDPFSISRSKIDLFLECPFCFYADRRLGVGRPPGFPFSLNVAVDKLLKKEFDIYRAEGVPHPLMAEYKILAKPFKHDDLDKWRENFVGVQYLHKPTNLKITGAIDDVWVNDRQELHVVDYKATSKESEVTLDAPWQDGYKRQMEIYQWLLRQNGFKVSDTGYFVYCNGDTDKEAFDGKLEFNVKIIPYHGKSEWVEKTIIDLKNCLLLDTPPASGKECDYCNYRGAVESVTPKKDGKKSNKILF
ncbi:MAG: PD-(D/E)XK nuclease family protein [Patescibacteria group bacterium]